jgi:hypothetical protein
VLARLVFTLATLLGLLRAAQPFTMYVSKGGSDGAGNGTFAKPYLTIQAAITAIANTGTAAQPWAIVVSSGTFASAFALDPWLFIVGAGRGATILANPSANWISANWAGATAFDGGILECTIATNALVVDFSAIASTGAGRFFLLDSLYSGVACTITGNGANNLFVAQNVAQIAATAALTHTFANIGTQLSDYYMRGNNITWSNNVAYSTTSRNGAIYGQTATVTATATSTGFNQIVNLVPSTFANANAFIFTGDRVSMSMATALALNGPDAATTFDFTTFTAGATKLLNVGQNIITAAPTADRAYTFNTPGAGTTVTVKNNSDFTISLVFVAGANNGMSYVGPHGTLIAVYEGASGWSVANFPQSGTAAALVAGVSPALIPADITAQSVIVATLKTFAGPIGTIQAKGTDRVVGNRGAGGGFKLTSVDVATGATVVTDTSVYDWIVLRP